MAQGDDSKQAIAQIIRQEQALIFPSFDENGAFAVGARIRDIAVKEKLGIATEISLWDRQLFYATTAGSTVDNQEWLRRKFNVVRRFHASTYRLVLEQNRDDRMFASHKAIGRSVKAAQATQHAFTAAAVVVLHKLEIGAGGGIERLLVEAFVEEAPAVAEHLGQDPVALALPAV